MLTGLTIGNFKAFGEPQHIPIRPLTLIFGANSSGKSSIIHALLLANHGFATGEFDVHQPQLGGGMVDLGGIRSAAHNHAPSAEISIGLEVRPDERKLRTTLGRSDWDASPFFHASPFSLVLRLAGEQPPLREVEITVDDSRVITLRQHAPGEFRPEKVECEGELLGSAVDQFVKRLSDDVRALEAALDALNSNGTRAERPSSAELDRATADLSSSRTTLMEALAYVLKGAQFTFDSGRLLDGLLQTFDAEELRREHDPIWTNRSMLSEKLEESQVADGKQPFEPEAYAIRYLLARLTDLGSHLIAQSVAELVYLGPLRHIPPRRVSIGSARQPTATGEEAWQLVIRDTTVLDAVNRFLGPAGVGTPYRLRRRELIDSRSALHDALPGSPPRAQTADEVDLVFEDAGSGVLLSNRDIGFGVGQVLPILVNASARRARLVAIEQPELHLHPAMQAELGDVFIESALGERKNTFLLETHSEHLILRIMRRMRETHQGRLPNGLPPVRPEHVCVLYVEPGPNGSIVREMPLNARGELVKSWPGGFFEEGFRELFG